MGDILIGDGLRRSKGRKLKEATQHISSRGRHSMSVGGQSGGTQMLSRGGPSIK